ncbi:hypothetical protein [Mesorhizobium erdmanii]|uniref:hypothetical protein n=1 Tax=Mesorhizobium erdmanii TaxID=1777866 RepID=UPI000B03A36A|nr:MULTISPECIES: hypothetical protein [Mesorhizobium]
MSGREAVHTAQGGFDPEKSLGGFDYIIFFVAILFLSVILFAGFKDPTVQSNILYLVVLSLSCSMVFAFLPFDARFEYKSLFKAGGTAAVFGFCLYIVTNFTGHEYIENKRRADDQITALQGIIKDKDSEIQSLRDSASKLSSGDDSKKSQIESIKIFVDQASTSAKNLHDDISEGIQFSSAARDNSSDSRTCSLRGSQSLAALSRAVPRLESMQSNLASALSLIK